MRALLKQGADVNAAQGDGMTALHWAAARGDVAQVAMLVYAGARLEAATRNGNYTPLHLAARGGRSAAVKALLKAGANAKAATTQVARLRSTSRRESEAPNPSLRCSTPAPKSTPVRAPGDRRR